MAVDYFLKIDGIPGESTDSRHKDEIEVLAWNWGESLATTSRGSGSAAGKVQMRPILIIAHTSSASPKLFIACAKGQHIPKAVLSAVRPTGGQGQDYMVWKFSEVIVTSYELGADEDDPVSTDEFNLEFAKVEVEYKPVKPDGSLGNPITAGWDIKTNKPV